MALSRLNIESQVRLTWFTLNGKNQSLDTAEAIGAVPDTLIYAFMNEATIDINIELNEDENERTTNTVKDSDEMAPPSDYLAIKELVIYPDYDDSASPSGTSAQKQGTTLRRAVTISDLYGHARYKNDFETVIESETDLSGSPSAYMIMERDNAKFIKFNTVCDHNYYIDVIYYTLPANMTTDADVPEIFEAYQGLIVDRVCWRIAKMIGDIPRKREFEGDFERDKEKKLRIINRSKTPRRLRPFQPYTQNFSDYQSNPSSSN